MILIIRPAIESCTDEQWQHAIDLLAEVRRRREEIQDELERETVREPSQADLRDAIGAITEAMESGTPSQRKALLQELVSEIRVESRDAIFPTYRLPNGPVRVISGVVVRQGLEPLARIFQ